MLRPGQVSVTVSSRPFPSQPANFRNRRYSPLTGCIPRCLRISVLPGFFGTSCSRSSNYSMPRPRCFRARHLLNSNCGSSRCCEAVSELQMLRSTALHMTLWHFFEASATAFESAAEAFFHPTAETWSIPHEIASIPGCFESSVARVLIQALRVDAHVPALFPGRSLCLAFATRTARTSAPALLWRGGWRGVRGAVKVRADKHKVVFGKSRTGRSPWHPALHPRRGPRCQTALQGAARGTVLQLAFLSLHGGVSQNRGYLIGVLIVRESYYLGV